MVGQNTGFPVGALGSIPALCAPTVRDSSAQDAVLGIRPTNFQRPVGSRHQPAHRPASTWPNWPPDHSPGQRRGRAAYRQVLDCGASNARHRFFWGRVGGPLSRNSLTGVRMSTAIDFSFRKRRLRPSVHPGGMIAISRWSRSNATIPPVLRHETIDPGRVAAVPFFQPIPPPRHAADRQKFLKPMAILSIPPIPKSCQSCQSCQK